MHPAVRDLKALAYRFLQHAREHLDDEAAAVGHILSAVSEAIDEGDLKRLNEKAGPHAWARAYLRSLPHKPGRMPTLPIETPHNHPVSMRQLSAPFWLLVDEIERLIVDFRRIDAPLSQLAWWLAIFMSQKFHMLPSLATADVVALGRRLDVLEAQERANPPRRAAENIAHDLLDRAADDSGWTAHEKRRAFKFLYH